MTMLSDSMITWFMPTIRLSRAAGTITRQVICRFGAADHVAKIDDFDGYRAQRQNGDAGHRRRGEDQRRNHGRRRAEAEQEQHRHQIGEDRDRLHQVEQAA
jgi:hypothetical protein